MSCLCWPLSSSWQGNYPLFCAPFLTSICLHSSAFYSIVYFMAHSFHESISPSRHDTVTDSIMIKSLFQRQTPNSSPGLPLTSCVGLTTYPLSLSFLICQMDKIITSLEELLYELSKIIHVKCLANLLCKCWVRISSCNYCSFCVPRKTCDKWNGNENSDTHPTTASLQLQLGP